MLIDPSTRRPHLQTDIPDDALQALAPPCSRVYIGSQTGVVVAYLSKSKIQVALYDTTVELNDTYIQGAPPPAVDYGSDVMHPLVRAFHNMRAVAAAVRYIPQPPHEGPVSARAALPKRTLAILKLALKQLWLSPSDALSLRLVSRGLSAAVLGSVDVTVDSDPSEGGTAIPTGLRGVVVGCLNKHYELAQFDISATSKLKAMFVTPAARAMFHTLCESIGDLAPPPPAADTDAEVHWTAVVAAYDAKSSRPFEEAARIALRPLHTMRVAAWVPRPSPFENVAYVRVGDLRDAKDDVPVPKTWTLASTLPELRSLQFDSFAFTNHPGWIEAYLAGARLETLVVRYNSVHGGVPGFLKAYNGVPETLTTFTISAEWAELVTIAESRALESMVSLTALNLSVGKEATVDDSVLQRLCASSLKAPLKRFSLTTLSDANSTPKSRASTMSHTAVAALRARFPSIIEVSIPLGIAYDAVTAGVLTDRSLRVLRVSFLGSVVARGLMMDMPALRTLYVHFHGNVELPPAWCFAAACPLLVDIRLVLSPTFSQGFSIAAVSSCRHLERCALEGWGPDEQSPDVHDHDVSQILLRCSNLTVLELRNLSNVTDAAATLALVSRLKRVEFSSCPKITAVASDYAAFLASTFNELRPLVFKLSTY